MTVYFKDFKVGKLFFGEISLKVIISRELNSMFDNFIPIYLRQKLSTCFAKAPYDFPNPKVIFQDICVHGRKVRSCTTRCPAYNTSKNIHFYIPFAFLKEQGPSTVTLASI